MSFDHCPRDLQLKIISKFDMDARIKCGIISKIKVPLNVVAALSNTFEKISHKDDGTEVTIGNRYMIFASKQLSQTNYCRCFVHIHANSTIDCYYLDSNLLTWKLL